MPECEHHFCRCLRAEELARMSDRFRRLDLLVAAVEVHTQKVHCRLVPPTSSGFASQEDSDDFDLRR
jgi:hypothetical protein